MNILQISDGSTSFNHQLLGIGETLSSQGHIVKSLCLQSNDVQKGVSSEVLAAHIKDSHKLSIMAIKLPSQLSKIRFSDISRLYKFRKSLSSEKFNLIHTQGNCVGLVLLASIGIDISIFISHNSTLLSTRLHSLLYRLNKVLAIFTSSEDERDRLMEASNIDGDKIIVVYDSISDTLYSDQFHLEQNDNSYIKKVLPENAWVIGYLWDENSPSNIDYVLDAFNQFNINYPKARLLIVYKNQNAARENKIYPIDSAQKNVVHHIAFNEPETNYLTFFDVMLFPQLTGSGISNALHHAVNQKIPVIATDVGSHYELIQNNKTGLLLKESTASVLVASFTHAINNKEELTIMAASAHVLMQRKMSATAQTDKIIAAFNLTLIKQKHTLRKAVLITSLLLILGLLVRRFN